LNLKFIKILLLKLTFIFEILSNLEFENSIIILLLKTIMGRMYLNYFNLPLKMLNIEQSEGLKYRLTKMMEIFSTKVDKS